jgi:hypothetical protein
VDTAPAYAACTSPYSAVGLAEGPHTFFVRTVGGTPGTPATYDWTIDLTVPDTTITGGPSGLSKDAAPQFTFSSSEQGTFQCSLDGGAYQACSSPDAVAGLKDGSHTIAVRAVDRAGNTDPTPATRTWTRDTRAPAKPDVVIGPALPARFSARVRGFHPVARNPKLHVTAAFQTTTGLQAQWRQPVAEPSITYHVSYLRLTPGTGNSTAFKGLKTAAKTRALAFNAATGYEYCFRVKASDKAGNTTTGESCTTMPYEASTLPDGDFPGHSGSGYYVRQYAQSKFGGGYLYLGLGRPFKKNQLPRVYVTRVALVATKCRSCGKVEVILSRFDQAGGDVTKQPTALDAIVNLKARTTKKKQVIALKTFKTRAPLHDYKLFVFGRGGKPIVEGIGVAAR